MAESPEAGRLQQREATQPSEEAKCLQNQKGEQPKAKKPYIKPAFRSEKVFETMALSCGKVQVTQHQCHSNRKSS
jgi:hypothetical protein